jgi:MFS family permease
VAVLTLAYIVSFVDRTILSLLIEPIKDDLGLSDTQIALVQGLAFGLFYAAMGLPLAWLADRMSRRLLIAVGAFLWCLATASCGFAGNFLQLFLSRIGVGVGEAALSPAAMSMISDSFPRERRALPIGVYTAAGATGAGLALLVSGAVISAVAGADTVALPLVGQVRPWQAAFVIVGLAGLVLVPLMATVVEPVRKDEAAARQPAAGDPAAGAPRLGAFVRAHHAFMLRHYLAIGLYGMLVYAVLSWVPAHFIRVHGWSMGEVALRYGLVLLVFGGSGTIVGAWVAQRMARRGTRHATFIVTAVGMVGAGAVIALAGTAASPNAALVWYAIGLVLMTAPGATAIQIIQEAVPNALRAQASAVYYLVISVVGLTLGPLSVALLTDYAFADPKALGTAIAIVAGVVGPVAAAIAWSARGPFERLVGR